MSRTKRVIVVAYDFARIVNITSIGPRRPRICDGCRSGILIEEPAWETVRIVAVAADNLPIIINPISISGSASRYAESCEASISGVGVYIRRIRADRTYQYSRPIGSH